MPRSQRAPWELRIAKAAYRKGMRTVTALVLLPARKLGRFKRVVRYAVGSGVFVEVPLYRNLWDSVDARTYEHALVDTVSARIRRLPGEVALVDCGADIGLVSLRLVAENSTIDAVYAFEPNSESFAFLQRNLSALQVSLGERITARAMNAAVANSVGMGTLVAPVYDASSHAWYLQPDPEGDISITTIDALEPSPSVTPVIKIDVEGGEKAVIEGARATLAQAEQFVVVFEAHRTVAERTGIDPMQCVRILRDLGATEVSVCEEPALSLHADTPFFQQVLPQHRVLNVVCCKL